MNEIKEFRKSLSLTQTIFADLLGCSREQLAQAEIGKRFLPSSAFNNFSLLMIEATKENSKSKKDISSELLSVESLKILTRKAKLYQSKLNNLQFILENLEEKLAIKKQFSKIDIAKNNKTFFLKGTETEASFIIAKRNATHQIEKLQLEIIFKKIEIAKYKVGLEEIGKYL